LWLRPEKSYSCSRSTLTDHLPGDHEIETVTFDPVTRPGNHEYLAVEAGIQVGAITIVRIEHHLFVFIDDIDNVQLDP
jgi:hypothetical protein